MTTTDPGVCPICGVAHAACTADSGPITIVQLPQRDGAELTPPPLVAEVPSETATEFTTGTYRRAKKG